MVSAPKHFLNLFLYFHVEGVGRKVPIRELMDIASADENDDHVILVRKYKRVQDAIKEVVYIRIGKLCFKMSTTRSNGDSSYNNLTSASPNPVLPRLTSVIFSVIFIQLFSVFFCV